MKQTPIQKILDFSGKVAIVTGGGSGMGMGIAKRFAETGVHVVITYLKSDAGALKVQKEIEADGGKCLVVQNDQRSVAAGKALVDEVIAKLGRIDILVNNAGIYPSAETLKMTEREWDDMLDSNLKGVFFLSQAVANQMIEQKTGGGIVNILSINADRPLQNALHYGASKAGLGMVTRCMAKDLGKFGIRVNAVAPGLIDSPMLDANVPGWRESYNARSAAGRIGTPTDIADACIFFVSPLSDWVTGQTLYVDGGVLLADAY